jgi:hypothetical protein
MALSGFIRRGRAPRRDGAGTLALLVAAEPTLVQQLGLTPSRRAGVCITPVAAAAFTALLGELEQVLAAAGRTTGTSVSRTCDDFGFQWFVLEDDDSLTDLVDAVRLVEDALVARGHRDQLLCAVFGAAADGAPLHLVHTFRTGRFHPVAPLPGGDRDRGAEERLRAGLRGVLPLEGDDDRCFPVWGAPPVA